MKVSIFILFQFHNYRESHNNKLLFQISETIVLKFTVEQNGRFIRKTVESLSIEVPLNEKTFPHEEHVEDQLTKKGISKDFVLLFADTRAIIDHKALNERASSLTSGDTLEIVVGECFFLIKKNFINYYYFFLAPNNLF